MTILPLENKLILVTGAGRRVGRACARASARAGADVAIHYHQSAEGAASAAREVEALGRRAWILQADFEKPDQIPALLERAASLGSLFGLVNNAAVFQIGSLRDTSLTSWQHHLSVNLTAPYLLAQSFVRQLAPESEGRIVNILDWRALRPEPNHLAYGISKAGLAALTRALALELAPAITVNGLALGAILPPIDGLAGDDVVLTVPAGRWGQLSEVEQALVFLLGGPAYVTGEIIHIDGGRHLV